MTTALQNSLISTLERGYNVSSIVNSLASIENAARDTKKALDDLNNSSGSGMPGNGSGGYSNNSSVDSSKYFTDNVGKNVGQSLNSVKNNNRYRLIDIMTGKPWRDNLTYEEAQKLYKDKNVASHTRIEKYASGTRNSKGGLIVKDEKGYEMMLDNQGSGKYALANEGSQIFTKEETDNMSEWVKFDPDTFMELVGKKRQKMELSSDELSAKLSENIKVQPPVVEKRVNNNNVNLHLGSMINVQGNLDSVSVKQVEGMMSKGFDKFMRRINDGIIYGR